MLRFIKKIIGTNVINTAQIEKKEAVIKNIKGYKMYSKILVCNITSRIIEKRIAKYSEVC